MTQGKAEAEKIFRICKMTIECIVSGRYGPLEECRALSRVSEQDIKRVLKEYNPKERPIMHRTHIWKKRQMCMNTGTALAGMWTLTFGIPAGSVT